MNVAAVDGFSHGRKSRIWRALTSFYQVVLVDWYTNIKITMLNRLCVLYCTVIVHRTRILTISFGIERKAFRSIHPLHTFYIVRTDAMLVRTLASYVCVRACTCDGMLSTAKRCNVCLLNTQTLTHTETLVDMFCSFLFRHNISIVVSVFGVCVRVHLNICMIK